MPKVYDPATEQWYWMEQDNTGKITKWVRLTGEQPPPVSHVTDNQD